MQFETLAGFSAVIDRLGEFVEVLEEAAPQEPSLHAQLQDPPGSLLPSPSTIEVLDEWHEGERVLVLIIILLHAKLRQ